MPESTEKKMACSKDGTAVSLRRGGGVRYQGRSRKGRVQSGDPCGTSQTKAVRGKGIHIFASSLSRAWINSLEGHRTLLHEE